MTPKLHLRVGGGITTIPPNIWQDNFLTGAVPFTIYPHLTTSQIAPVNYGFQITSGELPNFYTPSGQNVFASGKTNTVPANTVLDIERYQRDLAALTPGAQLTPLNLAGIDRRFGNGYLQTWTLGLERAIGKMTADATYIGTAAVRIPRSYFPNAYSGAGPGFARYTQFGPDGNAIGGFGTEQVIEATSHSSYHALQTSLQGTIVENGPNHPGELHLLEIPRRHQRPQPQRQRHRSGFDPVPAKPLQHPLGKGPIRLRRCQRLHPQRRARPPD